MQVEHGYDKVFLIPQECVVNSRSQCNITVGLGGRIFRNPVIASNMKSVVDFGTCEYLAEQGMFYVMHRFGIDRNSLLSFIDSMKSRGSFASISVGVKEQDRELIDEFWRSQSVRPEYITIDVAHGHSARVVAMIRHIKDKLPGTFVIAGNVATARAVELLDKAGADAVKIFIAPGSVCTTRVKTGFMRGTIECLMECAEATKKPVIADGGIKEPGHVAKAIAAGAHMVMAGSYMAGFDENSGRIVLINGEKKYIYYGSASWSNKGNNSHVEGTEIIIDYKGSMEEHIKDLECSLKSSVSYGGGTKLFDLRGVPMLKLA